MNYVYTAKGEQRGKELGYTRTEGEIAYCGDHPVDGQIAQAWLAKGYIRPADTYTFRRVGCQEGNCEDLYKCDKYKDTVFIRQRLDDKLVKWMTGNKWSGGYEADCSLRDGLTLNIVDDDGTVLFTEITYSTDWNGGGLAEKQFPFSWELERSA